MLLNQDKGQRIVILDRTKYIQKFMNLINTDQFKEIENDPTKRAETKKYIKNILSLNNQNASNVGTATYKTAKCLPTLLSPLSSSEYNIKNSYEFVKRIKNTKLPTGDKMISFDVKTYSNVPLDKTNVPLDKTIKIIIRKIYHERILDTSIPQKEMQKLLYLHTKQVHFSYGRRIYIQVGGVGME